MMNTRSLLKSNAYGKNNLVSSYAINGLPAQKELEILLPKTNQSEVNQVVSIEPSQPEKKVFQAIKEPVEEEPALIVEKIKEEELLEPNERDQSFFGTDVTKFLVVNETGDFQIVELTNELLRNRHTEDQSTETEASQSNLKTKKGSPLERKHYDCNTCSKRFYHRKLFKAHVMRHNPTQSFSCTLCEKTFKSEYILKCHIGKHTGEKAYDCSTCGVSFDSEIKLAGHSKRKHGRMSLKIREALPSHVCKYCKKKFAVASLLKRHVSEEHSESSDCVLCSKDFKTKRELLQHVALSHANDSFKCQECNLSFNGRLELRIHSATHNAAAFKQRVNQNLIMKYRVNSPVKAQEECKPPFKPNVLMKYRAKSPINAPHEEFKLPVKQRADRHFLIRYNGPSEVEASRKKLMKRRLEKINTQYASPFPFKKRRMEILSPESEKLCVPGPCDCNGSDFLCSKCGKTPGDSLICEHCQLTFESINSLDEHLLSHELSEKDPLELKPFICGQCQSSFGTEEALVAHFASHNLEPQPLICRQCLDMSFNSEESLAAHVKSHHLLEQKPFICEQCDASFETEEGLANHAKTIHVRDSPTELKLEGAFETSFPDQETVTQKTGLVGENAYPTRISRQASVPDNLSRGTRLQQNAPPVEATRPSIFGEAPVSRVISRDIASHTLPEKAVTVSVSQQPKTDKKSLVCGVCKISFHSVEYFMTHVKGHYVHKETQPVVDQNKPVFEKTVMRVSPKIKCDECGNIFQTEKSLALHAKTHHARDGYICDFCKRSFKMKLHLGAHIRIHLKVLPREKFTPQPKKITDLLAKYAGSLIKPTGGFVNKSPVKQLSVDPIKVGKHVRQFEIQRSPIKQKAENLKAPVNSVEDLRTAVKVFEETVNPGHKLEDTRSSVKKDTVTPSEDTRDPVKQFEDTRNLSKKFKDTGSPVKRFEDTRNPVKGFKDTENPGKQANPDDTVHEYLNEICDSPEAEEGEIECEFCKMCGTEILLDRMTDHLANACAGIEPFCCSICKKTFKESGDLVIHVYHHRNRKIN